MRTFIQLAFVFSSLCLSTFASSAAIDDGLIAYYPLDGNVLDASGNGHHGVDTGVAFQAGHRGQGAYFDGNSSHHIRVDGFPPIRSNLTVAAWFKPQNMSRPPTGSPIVTRGGFSEEAYSLFVDYEFVHVILNWNAVDLLVGTVFVPRFNDSAFRHVALVYNFDAGAVSVYFNGERRAVFDYSRPLYAQTEPLYFGVSFPGGLETFRGILDDVRIYNRALSSAEVRELVHDEGIALTIEVSEVRVCWNSNAAETYQIQYRSDLTTNLWANIGAPIQGNGAINCVPQPLSNEEQRFYRVIVVNQ